MLLFAFLIAGSFSFGKLATAAASAETINALRYIASVIAMGLFGSLVLKVPLQLPQAPWRFVLLGGLMAIYMFTMFKALEFTDPVSTGAVFTLMPLLSAGFAYLAMRQTTRATVLLSLVIAAVGAVWVIFRGNVDAILAFDVGRGELIFFIGVVCHAAYAPLLRKLNRGENPFAFSFWTVAATCIWLLLPGLPSLVHAGISTLPVSAWAAIAYLAIVTTIITLLLLQFASLRLPASKVLAYGYLTPCFIILLEGVLGHGWVSLTVLAGACVTALGLAIMAALPD
ncbi:DMT family transporter [Rhizobium sp. KVB221]|uniref:DMT family transporter n=2 Tax=Rhizobium setariae TaxID=2801340 RepID=A0A936YPV4_9HYPH|nr:DMT family transporter [Rhizobium setariae]